MLESFSKCFLVGTCKNIPKFILYIYITESFVMQHRGVVAMEIKIAKITF